MDNNCIDEPQQVGVVAHMVERSLRMREARGSIPRSSSRIFCLTKLLFFLIEFK